MKTLDDLKRELKTPYNCALMQRFDDAESAIDWLIDHLHTQGLLMVWNTDMDSAPRDGTPFIGWDELNNFPTIAFYNVSDDKYFTGFFHVDDVLGGVKLSAWMPLPKGGV